MNGTVNVEHERTTFLDDVRASHGEERAKKHTLRQSLRSGFVTQTRQEHRDE